MWRSFARWCADPNESVSQEIAPGQQFHVQRCKAPRMPQGGARGSKGATVAQQAAALADTVLSANDDGDFVVECKFDGWRVCAHVPDIDDEASARCASAPSRPRMGREGGAGRGSTRVACATYLD